MLAGRGPWPGGDLGLRPRERREEGVCEGLTKLQSYSWRRLAELRDRGWSRDRPRRFRPWEAPAPPRPAPPSAADPGSRRVTLGLRSQAVGPDTGLFFFFWVGGGGRGECCLRTWTRGRACLRSNPSPATA